MNDKLAAWYELIKNPPVVTDVVGPVHADACTAQGRLLLYIPDDVVLCRALLEKTDRQLVEACRKLCAKYPDLRPVSVGWFAEPTWWPKTTEFLVGKRFQYASTPEVEERIRQRRSRGKRPSGLQPGGQSS